MCCQFGVKGVDRLGFFAGERRFENHVEVDVFYRPGFRKDDRAVQVDGVQLVTERGGESAQKRLAYWLELGWDGHEHRLREFSGGYAEFHLFLEIS